MQLNIDAKRNFEVMFMGLNREHIPMYPRWLYKDGEEPLLVNNEQEAEDALKRGFDAFTAGALSNRYLINWFWDLEDMSARQLSVFAREEFGVDLPVEAGQEKLFAAVVELTRSAPQNHGRLILMAHSIEMNYTETLAEIQRVMEHPDPTANVDIECFEVVM